MTTRIPNRRQLLRTGAALVAAPAVIGTARAQSSITWKVQAHWPKASSSFDDSLVVVAKEIEERTKGQLKLQLFGAGEIAKGREIFNVVKRGVVEMGTISAAYILDEAQAMGLGYGVPGTLREPWELAHYLKNLGGEALINQELIPKGVYYTSEKTYPTELVLSKPLNSIDDFKKLKVRSSGTMVDYLTAAGAATVNIAGPEIYQSLSTGVVDGAHWGAAQGAMSLKLWEVAPIHMKPSMGINADAFILNKKALDKLPELVRIQLLALFEERFAKRFTEYQHKEAVALTKGRATMKVKVMQFPDAVQAKFAEASKAILAKEQAKGELGAKGAAALTALMKDLGYA